MWLWLRREGAGGAGRSEWEILEDWGMEGCWVVVAVVVGMSVVVARFVASVEARWVEVGNFGERMYEVERVQVESAFRLGRDALERINYLSLSLP